MSSLISLLSLGVRSGNDSGPETAPDTKRDARTNAATAIAWCLAIYSVLRRRLTSNPHLLQRSIQGLGGMRPPTDSSRKTHSATHTWMRRSFILFVCDSRRHLRTLYNTAKINLIFCKIQQNWTNLLTYFINAHMFSNSFIFWKHILPYFQNINWRLE